MTRLLDHIVVNTPRITIIDKLIPVLFLFVQECKNHKIKSKNLLFFCLQRYFNFWVCCLCSALNISCTTQNVGD